MILVLLAEESNRDEGDTGDDEEDLAEEEEVQQIDRGLSQLERSALSSRRHLKLENTLHHCHITFIFLQFIPPKKTIHVG